MFAQLTFCGFPFFLLHVTMPEGDISRTALRNCGIRYDENVYQVPHASSRSTSRSLPDHVDAVREALLSFESIIPEEWKQDLSQELDEFKDANNLGPAWAHKPQTTTFIHVQHNERAFQERSAEHIIAHENLKWSHKTAKRARQLLEESEAEWSFFWRSEVFLLFSDEARKQSTFM